MMLTERFSRLFSRLVVRWSQYQSAPRDPARVTDLAAARIALDEVRSEIAQERARITVVHPTYEVSSKVAVSDADLLKLRVAAIGLDGRS